MMHNMALSPAEQERRLKQRLKTELEKRGYFTKFSADGTITILRGEAGGTQEVIVAGLPIMEAGQRFKVWGNSNPCLTAEQREHPDRDPNAPTLDTPTTAALRADRQEANTMSSKTDPRERAKQIIADYQTGAGAFAGISPTKATGKAEATPQAEKPTPSADARREAMIQRQGDPTNAMEKVINRRAWERTLERRERNKHK